jgi:hypothetical protein
MQANKCVAGQEFWRYIVLQLLDVLLGVALPETQGRQTCYFDKIRVHRDQSYHVYVFYSR